ncbi:hypothetical protein D3C87_1689930 [compost metagenome]
MADVTQIKSPNNPGLSEKAYREFHRKLIKYNQKYSKEIMEKRMRGEKNIG